MDRDELLRASCFLALDALRAEFGDELPYTGGLDRRFVYDGRGVPFMNRYKGIHRAANQRGPAALSIMTSASNPYEDENTDDGIEYAYRSGDIDQPDNRALREAHALGVPLVYFAATRSGRFEAVYPCYVHRDDPYAKRVFLSPGVRTTLGDPEPAPDIDRRYLVRNARVRLHQARFRGLVLNAYGDLCTICRLREPRLLDASHIVGDAEPAGVAAVRNGLSLCSIHHRAYDHDLVGISPDYRVHVARRLLEDDDGPMLEILKGAEGVAIELPRAPRSRPDRELLAMRFGRFNSA